eukprot:189377-Pyramimonas_sp.AAC.1
MAAAPRDPPREAHPAAGSLQLGPRRRGAAAPTMQWCFAAVSCTPLSPRRCSRRVAANDVN